MIRAQGWWHAKSWSVPHLKKTLTCMSSYLLISKTLYLHDQTNTGAMLWIGMKLFCWNKDVKKLIVNICPILANRVTLFRVFFILGWKPLGHFWGRNPSHWHQKVGPSENRTDQIDLWGNNRRTRKDLRPTDGLCQLVQRQVWSKTFAGRTERSRR